MNAGPAVPAIAGGGDATYTGAWSNLALIIIYN